MCLIVLKGYNDVVAICKHGIRVIIPDWQHLGWRVVLQKELRSRIILGILRELIGLQLLDMYLVELCPNLSHAKERVPVEIARLNALVKGERHQEDEHGRARGKRGRGSNRRRLPQRN